MAPVAVPQNVRDLLTNRWGVPFVSRPSHPVINTAPLNVTAIKQDGARVGFLAVNMSGFPVYLAPQDGFFPASANNGVRLEPTGGAVSVNWEEDGEVVAWEWIATAIGGNSLLFVLEQVIDQGRHKA